MQTQQDVRTRSRQHEQSLMPVPPSAFEDPILVHSVPDASTALNAAIAFEDPILVGYRRQHFPFVGRMGCDRFVFLLHGLVFLLFLPFSGI
jgi:hypothetical protein